MRWKIGGFRSRTPGSSSSTSCRGSSRRRLRQPQLPTKIDYDCFAGLQSWATEHRIAVLALHHTRKGGADDPLEALSGSNGLSAVADTTLVLDRNSAGLTLYVRGRDVEEKESALQFDGGVWGLLGEAGEVRRSSERVTILVTLESATEPMSPQTLADVTGMKPGNVRKLLHSMSKAGEVVKSGRGQYIHPDNHALLQAVETPGNNGNAVTIRQERCR